MLWSPHSLRTTGCHRPRQPILEVRSFSLHSCHSILIPPMVICCLSRKRSRTRHAEEAGHEYALSCKPRRAARAQWLRRERECLLLTHSAKKSRRDGSGRECKYFRTLRPGPFAPLPCSPLHPNLHVTRWLTKLGTAVTACPVPDNSLALAHLILIILQSWPHLRVESRHGGWQNLPAVTQILRGGEGFEPRLSPEPGLTTTPTTL